MRSRSGTAVERASAAASMMSLRLHTKVDGATTLGAVASVTHPRTTKSSSIQPRLPAAAPTPANATSPADRAIPSLVMMHSSAGRGMQHAGPSLPRRKTDRNLSDVNSRLQPPRGVAQPGRALALGARSRWFESSRPDHRSPFGSLRRGHWFGHAARRFASRQRRRIQRNSDHRGGFAALGRGHWFGHATRTLRVTPAGGESSGIATIAAASRRSVGATGSGTRRERFASHQRAANPAE